MADRLAHAECMIALLVVVAACSKVASGNDSTHVAQTGIADSVATTISLPVAVEPARDGDLVLSILTSGQVRSERESKIKSEVGGTIRTVTVRPGQFVRRGQPLVFLDSAPFGLALRQKQIDVDRAQLQFLD